jgi:hypothetical protein
MTNHFMPTHLTEVSFDPIYEGGAQVGLRSDRHWFPLLGFDHTGEYPVAVWSGANGETFHARITPSVSFR